MGDQELPHKDTLIIAPGQIRSTMLEQLNERSRTVFRQLVETYLETGEPVGSRTLSRSLPLKLSAASIRNVMSDLEHLGLLRAPHTSAGRLPSERGLRLFVDGLLEIGDVSKDEREAIESKVAARGRTFEDVLQDATATLSGLSQCAGFVMSSKSETTLKHIEFVSLGPGQGLVVTVAESGLVENRLIEIPPGLPPSALQEATNYLNARLRGRTIAETRGEILSDIEARKVEIDELTQRVVEAGLAIWSSPRADESERTLIVRGQATLLENLDALEDLERVRMLFDDLERKRDLLRLLETAEAADGVQIFIGSESKLFSLSGSSVIVAPYKNSAHRILGVIGVIGPTRLNYARVIPMVDLTARAIGKMLS